MHRAQFVPLAAALCFATSAHGAITQYSSRAAFDAAAGTLCMEDFNSFAPTANAFEGVWYDFGDFSVLNQPTGTFGGDIMGSSTIDGTTAIGGVIRFGGATLTFAFDQPITALGFDADNLADQRLDELTFSNGDITTILDPIDQIRFWGFISDTPFTTVTFKMIARSDPGNDTSDGFYIDNVSYTCVPQPGTMGLLAASCIGVRRRRRTGG